MYRCLFLAVSFFMLMGFSLPALADERPVFNIIIKEHRFDPATLKVPANTKIKLIVDNQDTTPEEFESHELDREKVIDGGTKATILLGPLEPGRYPFFGEFNAESAQGVLIAE